MQVRRQLDRLEALGVLGLGPGASGGRIKRAYRRLALRYHPDRHRASRDEAEAAWCRARFREIGEAYAVLKLTLAADLTGQSLAYCARCGDLEPVWGGLDGNAYCRDCLLSAEGKRALPAPPDVLVRCDLAAATLMGAVACLVAWIWTEHQVYWWLTMGQGAVTIVLLLLICMVAPGAATPSGKGVRNNLGQRKNLADTFFSRGQASRPCPAK